MATAAPSAPTSAPTNWRGGNSLAMQGVKLTPEQQAEYDRDPEAFRAAHTGNSIADDIDTLASKAGVNTRYGQKAKEEFTEATGRDAGAAGGGQGVSAGLDTLENLPDQVLTAAGYGVDDAGPRPDADTYFGTGETSTSENLRRAYEAADKAGVYSTQGRVRDGSVTSRETAAPQFTTAHDPGAVERVFADQAQSERVTAPNLRDAERVTARSAGPVERAGTSAISPASLQNRTIVGQATDSSGAGQLLAEAAAGIGPSKAEALLDKGLDANSRKQRAMAAAAKGSERRGARRAAMLAIGEQGAQVAQDKAALRADEMAKARGEFSQYAQQAQALRQGAMSLQGQIDAARARGDADAVNSLSARQAEMDQQAKQFDARASNERGESDTGRASRADEVNAAAVNSRDSERAALEARTREGNAARGTEIANANASRSTSTALANAAAANARAESLARRTDESDQQYAARIQAWQEANATRDLQAQTTTLAAGQRADEGNIGVEQQDQQIRQSGTAQALGAAGTAAGQQVDIGGKKLEADSKAYAADKARQGIQEDARTQMLTKAGTAIVTKSDERLKENIEPVRPAAAARLADAYTGMVSTYKYKDGDGHTTAGGMAQQLERDPLGKKFVSKDSDGMRAVDYNGLHAAVIAGLAAKLDAQAQRTAKARRA